MYIKEKLGKCLFANPTFFLFSYLKNLLQMEFKKVNASVGMGYGSQENITILIVIYVIIFFHSSPLPTLSPFSPHLVFSEKFTCIFQRKKNQQICIF